MPPYFVQIKIIQVPELQLDGGGEGGGGRGEGDGDGVHFLIGYDHSQQLNVRGVRGEIRRDIELKYKPLFMERPRWGILRKNNVEKAF